MIVKNDFFHKKMLQLIILQFTILVIILKDYTTLQENNEIKINLRDKK